MGRPLKRSGTTAQKRHRAAVRNYKREQYKTPEGRMKALVSRAMQRAKERGLPFGITHADVPVPACCPLCEGPISLNTGGRKSSPSIDRINPEEGYEPYNVWVVCDRCNTLKSDSTLERFERMARNWRREVEQRAKRLHGAHDARHSVDPGKVPVVRGGGTDGH